MDVTPDGTIIPRRSRRQTHTPIRCRDYVLMDNVINVVEPLNYEQVKDKKEWVNPMNE